MWAELIHAHGQTSYDESHIRVSSLVSRTLLNASASLWTAYAISRHVLHDLILDIPQWCDALSAIATVCWTFVWRTWVACLTASNFFRVHVICDTTVAAWGDVHVCHLVQWWCSDIYQPLLRHSGVINPLASRIMYMYLMYIYIGGSFRTMTANTWSGLEKENIQNSIESMYFAFLTTIYPPFALLFFLFFSIPKPSTCFSVPLFFFPLFLGIMYCTYVCVCG
jgi:hypothetical protein